MADLASSLTVLDGLAAPIFGPSIAMNLVLEQVTKAAAGQLHVLISGESGTGREMVAREIHRRSRSSSAGFAKLNCTVRPPHELEIELFGNVNASVDGRSDEGRGLERIARGCRLSDALGGTIFFEQLTHMPARVQARLARVLRAGEVIVFHQREPVPLNLRAIGSVEQNYDQAVDEGRIRDDLHGLMSGVRINLLPLRNRREDVPALATCFIDEYCRRSHLSAKTLSESARLLLSALPWHGNGTELRELMHGLVHRVRSEVIQLRDVLNAVEIDGRARPSVAHGTLREARTAFEHEYIAAVLLQHHGRIPDAARTLGIQRTNLYRKLKRLRLTPSRGRPRES